MTDGSSGTQSSSSTNSSGGKFLSVVIVVAVMLFGAVGFFAAMTFLYLGVFPLLRLIPWLPPALVGPASFLAALLLLLWGSFEVYLIYLVYFRPLMRRAVRS